MKVFSALCCAAALITAGCGTSRKSSSAKNIQLDTLTVSANNNPMNIYREAAPRDWEIDHIDAQLSFDMAKEQVTGTAAITIRPFTERIPDTIVFDAKNMVITKVAIPARGGIHPLKYSYSDNQLSIPTAEISNLFDGARHLIIEYKTNAAAVASNGSAAIKDDRGVYFINAQNKIKGKPVQIWTQGETEATSNWLPCIDKPNQRFTLKLALTVPDSFTTLSNGVLISSKPAASPSGNSARPTAPPPSDGAGGRPSFRTDTWEMAQPIQAYAAMFAIGKFSVVDDKPSEKGIPVNYYVEPEYAPYAREMFRNTPEMIDYFSQYIGVSYPWPKYSQVVVRDYVSGAMENTSASLFGEFMNETSRELLDKDYEDVVSHELFHQWFGDYVTAESWSNLTLSESFATYGEVLWRRHKYGNASADKLAFNDLYTYIGAARNADPPLVRFYYKDKEDMFDRISYQKGGAILRYMHSLMGDAAFRSAMRIYLNANALQSAEHTDWRKAVEQATGRDWTQFFNEWYLRGGHPLMVANTNYNAATGKLDVKTRQHASVDTNFSYSLSVPVKVIRNGAVVKEDVWQVNSKRQSFSYELGAGNKNDIITVLVDTGHVIPGQVSVLQSMAAWQQQLSASNDYVSKTLAIGAAFFEAKNDSSAAIFKAGLKDDMQGVVAHTLRILAQLPKTYKGAKTLEQDIKMIALGNNRSNEVRIAAFDAATAWQIGGLEQAATTALADSSYSVAGSALSYLSKLDTAIAYAQAKKALQTDARDGLETAALEIIADAGRADDTALFAQRAIGIGAYKKLALTGALESYAASAGDEATFSFAMRLIAGLSREEAIPSYRGAIGAAAFVIRSNMKELLKETRNKENKALLESRIRIADEIIAGMRRNETAKEVLDIWKEAEE